ncbi:hypothetical protein [Cumulibacter manganitolerans]|uniref:hypothetical protein n=1 Tax=Cumulibacter manganitolerans TaxID=1884992 RepID=UPI001296A087|nr:hypothetical protein [Cumulibacter manganitolerans]
MSVPTNDPYGRDARREPAYDGREPAYDARDPRRDPAYDARDARRDPAYDGRDGYDAPPARETYVERDRLVAPPQERLATKPRANPAAGILLIVGGLMGVLWGLIPGSGSKIPLAQTVDLFKAADVNSIIKGAAIIVVFLCGLGVLAAGAQMFAPKWHAGAARTGMTLGILMLIASLALIIVGGTSIFNGAQIWLWLLLLACIPTIIGALVGFARK